MSQPGPRVRILYCSQCNFLLRAGWLAQELLSTFGQELGAVTLVPGGGGVFQIQVDDTLVWDRVAEGRFPQAKELKQRVRDVAFPERHLGHSDTK